MKKHILDIGEVKTVSGHVTFTCLGLGSCIGLFLQDRTAGISGGAHILLPGDTAPLKQFDGRYYNVRQALDRLFEQFRQQGSKLMSLRAKVSGGAQVFHSGLNIGSHNATSLIDQLISKRIYIAAVDVGGRHSRTVNFYSHTGEMQVRNPENNGFTIF